MIKDNDLQFLKRMNDPENKGHFQKSLGVVLRQRREVQEKIEIERNQILIERFANPPKESDSKGTAY